MQISKLSQSVTETQAALAETESEISFLSREVDQLTSEKIVQSKILERAIRTAYRAGNHSAIKLLLNQEDISKSARMLHYHRLITQAQLDCIASFQETLDKVQTVNQRLESNVADLETEQLTLINSLQSLNDSKIERAVGDIPEAMQRSPFDLQLGKLPIPVTGKITDRFGSRYGEGDLTRQGITIAVSAGTPVQTIHPGRVVFSDWLRGAGLLVIVDHGQGYMSLYGANQALSKQAGNWVDNVDIVSTLGMTNELTGNQRNRQASPSMYFEIRHHDAAQNPAQWFSE